MVTGGAQGLGREICLQLSSRQWRVAVVDLVVDQARQTVNECSKYGASPTFIRADLSTSDGPEIMVYEAVQQFGRLDVLINCAAYAKAESFLAMSSNVWEQSLLVNVRGVALAICAAAHPMMKQGGGRIINITSPASRMALPNYTAYAASKAAVDSITRAAAVALAGHNIQVNGVAPGMMDTAMQQQTEIQLAALEGGNDLQAFIDARTARIPVGRRTTCEEVAQAVVWLAEQAPSYITAERLNISGGLDKD
jgi:NAD(P)-dependent dehydrogenase (short-subunit alcohol dehydrogenase family)